MDEVAGASLAALIAGPMAPPPLALLCVGFFVLDRLKPWPFSMLEHLPGGWGVMADDLVLGATLGLSFLILRWQSRRV